ncbi:MAG: LysR family transcriptional regulator [Myxococcota bacterium]
MDRARRLSAFWSWLPAFRAVAETEHLPSASADLHVTPSALSRTIRLLEEEVGKPLFERTGRRLELNEAGQLFARAVRDAMRLVHEGLLAVEEVSLRGALHVSVPGPMAPLYILPLLPALREAHPHLIVHLHAMASAAVNPALRRGDIDIALLDDPLPADDITITRLDALAHDVFVAPGNDRPLEELIFAAPIPDARGVTSDAWPMDRPRQIGLRVTRMQVAIDAVRMGAHAAVLPVAVGTHQGLKGLGMQDAMGTTALFMAHRPALPVAGRTEVFCKFLLDSKE